MKIILRRMGLIPDDQIDQLKPEKKAGCSFPDELPLLLHFCFGLTICLGN